MRMRHKRYARPELAACPYFVSDPARHRGRWQQLFAQPQPLILELGCGKGSFAAGYALAHPQQNYLAIDCISDVLVLAKHRVDEGYAAAGRAVDNLRLTALNIQWIEADLGEEDRAERLYINFCNPWPKKAHHKRRLTYPTQLLQYRTFLADGGEIWFKTDDDDLFEDSLTYFADCGFTLRYLSRDLHADEPAWNLRTEYEERFSALGVPIKALIAVKGPLPENAPHPAPPRRPGDAGAD